MQTRLKALCAGIIAASMAFVPLFAIFDWAFIEYWEWQHEGRKMKFTLWADERALPLALSLCAVVFYMTVRHLQRNAPADQQVKRRTLVIAGVSGAALMYFSIVARFLFVLNRFNSTQLPRQLP